MSNSTESAERQAFEKWYDVHGETLPAHMIWQAAWQAAIRDSNATPNGCVFIKPADIDTMIRDSNAELYAALEEIEKEALAAYGASRDATAKLGQLATKALARHSPSMGGNVTDAGEE